MIADANAQLLPVLFHKNHRDPVRRRQVAKCGNVEKTAMIYSTQANLNEEERLNQFEVDANSLHRNGFRSKIW